MADSPVILAAGALIWRPSPRGPEVGIVHRPRYDDWSLPKGKPDPGENLASCAVREVFEETGLQTFLSRPLGTTNYETSTGPKVVHYWSVQIDSDEPFVPNEETDALLWLSPPEAAQRLTYPHDADLVLRNSATTLDTHTVLVVRHAHAGSRASWAGEDIDRPLDETGMNQALALVSPLSSYGPTMVRSARPQRCRQTVAPLASALSLSIVADESLDDEVILEDPLKAALTMREWAGTHRCVVLCSQGNGIPAAVQALCAADDVTPSHERFPSRKGSTWVLSVVRDSLVAADYFAFA